MDGKYNRLIDISIGSGTIKVGHNENFDDAPFETFYGHYETVDEALLSLVIMKSEWNHSLVEIGDYNNEWF